ncbi:CHAT domain-containing protein [Lacihabitans sp. CS3-21]|uniref:CHAT domain-containing protein n=1 Tax=Lacihabitans sp. CS3-21 TaxID=2487332 RepID=UPI0020CB8164|nr:CHAT domain-containing protein [Lacihabitans sp. CS3-21]MCP9749170.1 CHAT domain-containing protein [Lacihabitans sp. CS3-21]
MTKILGSFSIFFLLFLFSSNTAISQSKVFADGLKKIYDLDDKSDYKAAKAASLSLKSNKSLSSSEKNFIDNYILLFDFKLSDDELIKNVELGIKNLSALKNRKPYETTLLLNFYTAKYHYIAYSGDWSAALTFALKGLEIKDFNQAMLESRTDYLYDLGYLYDTNDKNFEAISYYKTSLGQYIRQFGEVSTHTALTYNNLAYAYSEVGNEKNAITYYTKAANIWEKVHKTEFDRKDYLITVYQNLTYQYIGYGDYAKAQQANIILNAHYLKKYSTEESKKLPTYFEAKKSYVLNNIRIHLINKELEKANLLLTSLIKDPIFSYDNPKDLRYFLQSSDEILEYYIQEKKYNEALQLAKKTLSVANKYKSNHHQMMGYSKISKIYNELKDYPNALKFIELAIQNINPENFSSSKFTLKAMRADINLSLNLYPAAIKDVKQNLEDLVFELSKKSKSLEKIEFKDVKEIVSLNFIKVFTKSGEVYLKNYKVTKNKKDLIQAEKLYKIASKLFFEYYQKGEYNETLNEYHSEIIEGLLSTATEKKLSKVELIEYINSIEENSSQHLFKEYLKKAYKPDNAHLRTASQIKDLEGELNYYKNLVLTDKELISKNNLKINTLENKINKLLESTSETYRAIREISVLNFDVNEVLANLKNDESILKYYIGNEHVYVLNLSKNHLEIKKLGLVSALKPQMEAFLTKTKNINADYQTNAIALCRNLGFYSSTPKISIIPEGFLSYLPFESLIDPQSKQFIVLKNQLSYHYSLSIWLFNQQNNIDISNKKLIAFSPQYNQSEVSLVRAGFADLKFAREEATAIASMFGGETVKNHEATKARFLSSIDKFGIFHFSMHSQLFEDDFNKSCLVFSNNEKLFFSELYSLNFPAKMAVLSACDTGNGILKSGEGIMSISRALTYAGVQSSVYSLWQVPDKETAEIIIDFYKNLKEGQYKDEALSNAKKTFISKNPLKAHPYFWAGFVVNGNTEPLEITKYWLWILMGLIGLSALFLVFRIKK